MNAKFKKGMVSALVAMMLVSSAAPALVSATSEISSMTNATSTEESIAAIEGKYTFLVTVNGIKSKVTVNAKNFQIDAANPKMASAKITADILGRILKNAGIVADKAEGKNYELPKVTFQLSYQNGAWEVSEHEIAFAANKKAEMNDQTESGKPVSSETENSSKPESSENPSSSENSGNSSSSTGSSEGNTSSKPESTPSEGSGNSSSETSSEGNTESSKPEEGAGDNGTGSGGDGSDVNPDDGEDETPVAPPEIGNKNYEFKIDVSCSVAGVGHTQKYIYLKVAGDQFTKADDGQSAAILDPVIVQELVQKIVRQTNWGNHEITANNISGFTLRLVNNKWVADSAGLSLQLNCEPKMEASYTKKVTATCFHENHSDKKVELTIDSSKFTRRIVDGKWKASYLVQPGSAEAEALKTVAGWKNDEKTPHTLLQAVNVTMTYDSKKGWVFDEIAEFPYGCVKKLNDSYQFNFTLKCSDGKHKEKDLTIKNLEVTSDQFVKQYQNGKWTATVTINQLGTDAISQAIQGRIDGSKWKGNEHRLTKPLVLTLTYDAETKKWNATKEVTAEFNCSAPIPDSNFEFKNVKLDCIGDEAHKTKEVKNIKISGKDFAVQYTKEGKWIASYTISEEKDLPENISNKLWKGDHRLLSPAIFMLEYKDGKWVAQQKESIHFTCAPEMGTVDPDTNKSYLSVELGLVCSAKGTDTAHEKHKKSYINLNIESGWMTPYLHEDVWYADFVLKKDSDTVKQILAQTGWGTDSNHNLQKDVTITFRYVENTKNRAGGTWVLDSEDGSNLITLQFTKNASSSGGSGTGPSGGGSGGGHWDPNGPGGSTGGTGTTPGTTTPGTGTSGGAIVTPGTSGTPTVTVPVTPTNRPTGTSPKTGDHFSLFGILALAATSIGGGTFAFFKKRKQDR